MNIATRRLALAGIGLSLLTVLASCVAGVGYDSDVGVGYYSPGFVEPFGYDYGGWGGGYRVGPGRGGELRPSASSHAFRGASHSRSTPSIPSGSRGGGSRGHR